MSRLVVICNVETRIDHKDQAGDNVADQEDVDTIERDVFPAALVLAQLVER